MKKEQLNRTYDICFFDLDGTIIDSSPGITNSVIYALKKFGIEETDRAKLYKFIGPPLTDSFAITCKDGMSVIRIITDTISQQQIFLR